MNIWAKLITNGKNVKDIVYKDKAPLAYANYEQMLRNIAELLDIPCPLCMQKHFADLKKFNIHRFKPDDFIESLDYDWLELENF